METGKSEVRGHLWQHNEFWVSLGPGTHRLWSSRIQRQTTNWNAIRGIQMTAGRNSTRPTVREPGICVVGWVGKNETQLVLNILKGNTALCFLRWWWWLLRELVGAGGASVGWGDWSQMWTVKLIEIGMALGSPLCTQNSEDLRNACWNIDCKAALIYIKIIHRCSCFQLLLFIVIFL